MRQHPPQSMKDQFFPRCRDAVLDLAWSASYILEAIILHFFSLNYSSLRCLDKGLRHLLDFAINGLLLLGFSIAISTGIVLGLVAMVSLGMLPLIVICAHLAIPQLLFPTIPFLRARFGTNIARLISERAFTALKRIALIIPGRLASVGS